MADIDQIIAGGAGASSRADFSGIPKILDSYWTGQDQRAKNDLRDAFKGGLPMKDGSPDWDAITQTLFQAGATDQGLLAAKQAYEQQNLASTERLNARAFPVQGGPQAQAQPLISPPASRGVAAVDAPPRNSQGGETGAPQPGRGPVATGANSIVGVVGNTGISDELAGPEINKLGGMLSQAVGRRVDANEPLDMGNPQVRTVLAGYQRDVAQQRQGGQPAPQQVAQAPQAQPQQPPPDFNERFGNDPTMGGLVPQGRTAAQQLNGLTQAAANGRMLPAQAKVYQSRIDAIQKELESTNEQKILRQMRAEGFKGSMEQYLDRPDDAKQSQEVLKSVTIPALNESHKTAIGADKDIDAIHRSRAELDKNGGIFNGKWADMRLEASKIGRLLGLGDVDKIQNTEAFAAVIGQRVAALVKAFGSGTGISEGDRKYSEKMAGGNITLDEKSIREILDVGERVARALIVKHNNIAERAIKVNSALKESRDTLIIAQPGQYKKAVQEKAAEPNVTSSGVKWSIQ